MQGEGLWRGYGGSIRRCVVGAGGELSELRVDLAEIHKSGVQVGEIAGTVKSVFANSDTELASAQSGWAGESAAALASVAAEWQETTAAYYKALSEHGEKLTEAARKYGETDETGASSVNKAAANIGGSTGLGTGSSGAAPGESSRPIGASGGAGAAGSSGPSPIGASGGAGAAGIAPVKSDDFDLDTQFTRADLTAPQGAGLGDGGGGASLGCPIVTAPACTVAVPVDPIDDTRRPGQGLPIAGN